MSYYITNSIPTFDFHETYISEIQSINGYFYAILDNVTILPENPCNRDIRKMRTNGLRLTLKDGVITSFIEEGYKLYDANGQLSKEQPDLPVEPSSYTSLLKTFEGCPLYSLEKQDRSYVFYIDGEERTYTLTVKADEDSEEWERFFNLAE